MHAAAVHPEPVAPPPPTEVTVTMTGEEAQALQWLAGYCSTATKAIYDQTQAHPLVPMSEQQRDKTIEAGTRLYYALRDAGITTP